MTLSLHTIGKWALRIGLGIGTAGYMVCGLLFAAYAADKVQGGAVDTVALLTTKWITTVNGIAMMVVISIAARVLANVTGLYDTVLKIEKRAEAGGDEAATLGVSIACGLILAAIILGTVQVTGVVH